MLSFLGITYHYIDSDWKLKDILVDFICLEGSHSGENLANSFIQYLQKKILQRLIIKKKLKFIYQYILTYFNFIRFLVSL